MREELTLPPRSANSGPDQVEHDWGFNFTTKPVSDAWSLMVGMNRTLPNVPINQWVYTFFDNIRVAASQKQADPAEVYPW